jgi:hypothetical protein
MSRESNVLNFNLSGLFDRTVQKHGEKTNQQHLKAAIHVMGNAGKRDLMSGSTNTTRK